MVINIKTATTKKDKGKCFSIRQNVFVKEQNISEKIEFDDENVDATYFIAQYKNIFVGTARYRLTDFGIKLERFAVLKSYRNAYDTSLPCIRSRTGFVPGQVSISTNGTKLQLKACFKDGCKGDDIISNDIDVSLK